MKESMRIPKFVVFVLSVLMSSSVAFRDGYGQEFGEHEVKAAFIFNIAKFVEWPDKSHAVSGTALNLCVLGSDHFGGSVGSTYG